MLENYPRDLLQTCAEVVSYVPVCAKMFWCTVLSSNYEKSTCEKKTSLFSTFQVDVNIIVDVQFDLQIWDFKNLSIF